MATTTPYFNKMTDYEKDLTSKIKKQCKDLKLVHDKKTQESGIDAFCGGVKIDFKFINTEPLVEVQQSNFTTWCTNKHDGNILIWFINADSHVDWCFYLKDLVKVKREMLNAGMKPHKVKATGTTLFWMKDWITVPTEVRRPFKIDFDKLEEK